MANKTLTIDVKQAAIPSGVLDKWSPLGNTTVFIKNILTPKLSKKNNIGQLVSGIPTAFARVDLFKTALDHVATDGDALEQENNLVGYYSRLVDEWYGLIACIALDYAHISVRRIALEYSDGKDISATANVYEPKGAFGNMLLRRKSRWCEQNVPENQISIPYINVIKYRDKVIGATSPESLLFTSTGYTCDASDDCPWIGENGKFINPLRAAMKPMQVATLYAYVEHILKGLDAIEQYYQGLPESERVNYKSIRKILQVWKDEITTKAESDGIDLSETTTPPVSAQFGAPFEQLFCHKDILYGVEGNISEKKLPGGVEFDPKNLLLEDTASIARLGLNVNPDELRNLPVLMLTADVKGTSDKAYFSLPLSAQGLNVFGKNVAALVGMAGFANAIKSTLRATYNPAERADNLEVELTLVTSEGIRRPFKKVYTAGKEIVSKDILIWPNFISPQWDAYFMYSELPHNGTSQDYRAFPFVGEMQGDYFRVLVDEQQSPILLSRGGSIVVPEREVKAELLVTSGEAVADNPYKYEIYRTNKPFKGVRLLSPTEKEGGYLLINYSSAQGTALPHDWMRPGAHTSLQPVRLGIDFGSTNTSIAYSSDNTQERGLVFRNQRVSLMGNELPGCELYPKENQVFFFQGAGSEIQSNAIKSVLTLHDHRRLPPLRSGQTIKMRNGREVVGGFPSFADNLPFSNSKHNKITLCYPNGVGEVTQIHNMKWEDSDEDKAHKSAFLRTLMLQVYATLFVDGFVPESVKWSYPSAMSGQILYSYQTIWESLKEICPVLKEDGERLGLNVSRYIDTRQIVDGTGGSPFEKKNNDFSGGGFSGGFGNGFNDTTCSGFGEGFGNSGTSNKQTLEYVEDLMPDANERIVKYNPKPLYTMENLDANPSLSEAEAVANFISVRYGTETNVLNLCFDVGGSTTDISALFYLTNGVTMIKQNSLRFAAQRVSQSVSSFFPQFRKVIGNICEKYRIEMVGFTFGNDTYNGDTAPYFFDQILNRLNDEQLNDLYHNIAAECPKLMCVNMYVTGLLMYYAGQIAHKLVDDLSMTAEDEWNPRTKPRVRITFAGKGARLYQWLNAINPQAAEEYYNKMFVKGFGEEHLKNTLVDWQKIELPCLGDSNIKYEVSKGLAKGDTVLWRPSTQQPSEIIGESGFEVTGADKQSRHTLEFTNSITPTMIKSIGVRFCTNNNQPQADKFTEFCGFFYSAASQLFGWRIDPKILERACRDMNIVSYVQNMPEWRAALRESQDGGNAFGFVAPIIILEGMKFYDTVLLKKLQ